MTKEERELRTLAFRQDSPEYYFIREVPGMGLCGIRPMFYTVGIFYDIDVYGCYKGRYCYGDLEAAKDALARWDRKPDPPGPWIARKGDQNYHNPEWKKKTRFIGT
jgi:hypothetical protein